MLPGVYKEEPSRRVPNDGDACSGDEYEGEEAGTKSYKFQRDCPNVQNLIAIVGDDDDADRRCDDKCNLQIEGPGAAAGRQGRRRRLRPQAGREAERVPRRPRRRRLAAQLPRAVLGLQQRLRDRDQRLPRSTTSISRWSREYGFLTFAGQRPLRPVKAYGSGDSGIYPGSGPEGHCARYGIEIRYSESYGNTIGWSGTAGNGVWTHHSKFHDNAAGITMDSSRAATRACRRTARSGRTTASTRTTTTSSTPSATSTARTRPNEKRDPRKVCPTFQVPVGTGILTGGGNGNIFRNNWVYDNWRRGTMLFWVPGELRGDDPTGSRRGLSTYETSHHNQYIGNRVGYRPDGARDPNGVDFWWDEEGGGNCWSGNRGPGGGAFTSDPTPLFACPGGSPDTHGQHRQAGRAVPLRHLGPEDQHRSGRLRLVRAAARAEVVGPKQPAWPAALVVAGCAGGRGRSAVRRRRRRRRVGRAVWVKQPTIVRQQTLPRDRVLVGTVRNDSLRRLTLEAKDVRAVDEDGAALKGNATFIRGYVHPLYPPTRPPAGGCPSPSSSGSAGACAWSPASAPG